MRGTPGSGASRQRRSIAAAWLAATCLAAPAAAQVPQVDEAIGRGRAWLVASQNPDGSFGGGGELLPRDTALAVLALAGGGDAASVGGGVAYLTAAEEQATQYRALRVLSLAGAGAPYQALLDTLGDFRNGTGMGAFRHHASNAYDSALALQAYGRDEAVRLDDILPLVDDLLARQNGDGGWGFLPETGSETYFTGEALWALAGLERLSVSPAAVAAAQDHLASRQLADGGWGADLATAMAYRALLASGHRVTELPASPAAALLASQQADGSWGGDVFTTAHAVLALAGHLPNLRVASVTADPPTVAGGGQVLVTVVVENVGPVDAPETVLELRAGAADGTDVRAQVAVPALAAGVEVSLQAEVSTLEGDAGELVVFAVADAAGAVAEGDEGDNARSVRIVLQDLPDLAIFPAQLTVVPARPRPDEPFELRAVVQNLGEQEVPSFSYRLSRTEAGAPVEVLGEGVAGPLAAGGSLLLTASAALPEGEHAVLVELDLEDAVVEASEEDNATSHTFFVVDDTLPDFVVAAADLTAGPLEPAAGDPVAFSLTVRNTGLGEGTAFVEVFDGDPASGTVVLSESVALAAGASATLTGSFTAADTTFVVTAVADRAQELVEEDEGNNRAAFLLRELPDLAVGHDNLTLVPAAPLAGDAVDVDVTVRNAGTLAAPPAAVALFAGDPSVGGVEVARGDVDAIPPGGNRSLRLRWPAAAGGLTELVVVADPDDLVRELAETNNAARRRLAVPRATGPNLEIAAVDRTALVHSPVDLAIDGSVGLTLANSGDAAATAAFLLRLFEDLDGDGIFAGTDRELASAVIGDDLAAGGTLTVQLAVADVLSFASSRVLAYVDAADTVAETREDDNLRELFADCAAAAPAAPSFEAVESWYRPGVEIQNAPVVVQLGDDDGDGAIDSRDVPDIVFHAADAQGRLVLAVSGLDGSELWSFRSSPANPLQGEKAHLSAADLDGDGVVEILAVQTNNRLVALDHTGALRWVSDAIEKTGGDWRGGSAVGDLTGDGVPEIVVGRAVLSNEGRLLGIGTANAGRNHNAYGPMGVAYLYDQQHSILADLDLDGIAEVIAGDAAYRLVDGVLETVWNADEHDNMLKDGFSAVANLDADPYPEIVYVSAGFVKVLNHDGSTRTPYRRIVPIPIPLTFDSLVTYWGGPPTVADLTGDGVPEILVAGDTELVAMTAGLGTLWRKPTFDFAAMTSATAFDLDGDGRREVIYADERSLFVLDGATGAVLHQRKNTSLTGTELPVVADVDGDGVADLVVPSSHDRRGDRSTLGLHVLSHPSWVGARPIWNQHSYHVTNVRLDGTVPQAPTPSWQLTNTFRANLELPKPPRRLANPTIGLPRVGAAGAQGIPVTLRVGNGGAAWAPAGVAVALSAAGGTTPVATAATVAALPPGGWEDVVVHWQGALEQPILVVAEVDPGQRVAQCEEADDQVSFELAEALLPDLAIPPAGVSFGGTATAGQVLALVVEVRNDGNAIAPATRVRVTDGAATAAAVLGETEVPDLAAGESTTVGLAADTLGLGAGLHNLHVRVDPDALVAEEQEANNVAVLPVELAAPALPDLETRSVTAEPAQVAAGESVLLRATVVNRGLALADGFDLAFRLNGAEVARVDHPASLAAGASATLETSLSTLGRKGTLLVEAAADPGQRVAEVDEANNRATTQLAVLTSPVTLSLTTDKARYRADETVQVAASAFNAGTDPVDAVLLVVVQGSGGAEVARLAEQAVTLAPGAATFAASWPTTQALPGPYAVVGTLAAAAGTLARGSASLSLGGEVAVAAELVTDRSLYDPHDTVVLHGGVRNLATGTLLEVLTATLSVRDAADGERFRQEVPLGQVVPGGFVALGGAWDAAAAPPGDYRAELAVRNAYGELLASTVSPFAIADSGETGAGLRGTLRLDPAVQGVGGPVAVSYRIDNHGNSDVPGLVVHLELRELSTGEIVARLDRPQPVLQGGSVEGVWRLDTAARFGGEHVVSLAAVVGGGATRLASEPLALLPGLLVDDLALREGDGGTTTAQVRVRLLPPHHQPVTVAYATSDASAAAGSDYQAASGTLTFAPGETEQTVAVTVFGDLDDELPETFLVGLSDATVALVADDQAVVTIEDEEGCASTDLMVNPGAEEVGDDESILGWTAAAGGGWRVAFADPPAFEGTSYFAAVAGEPAELAQEISLDPFAARIDAGVQELVFEGFARSEGGARLVVEYLDAAQAVLDRYDSGDLPAVEAWQAATDRRPLPPGARRARVRLLSTGAGTAAFDRLSLRSLGVVTLAAGAPAAAEGAGSLDVALELSCASPTPVAVAYHSTDLEALAGQDYQAVTGSVTIPAGELAALVAVPILDDGLDEDAERLQLHLASDEAIVLTSPVAGTVLDDDGIVTLSVAPAAVGEGDAGTVEAVFVLALSEPSGREVRVDYATAPATATAGADFQGVAGTAVFPPGVTEQRVTVLVAGDRVDELVETFHLELRQPVNATLAAASAAGTIVDDDTARLAIEDAEIVEGDAAAGTAAMLRLTLSVPSDREVSAAFATLDGTATSPDDFPAAAGTVRFAPGAIDQVLAVAIVGDLLEETTESFLVELSNAANAELADPEATVTVVDDDGPVLSIDDVSILEGNAGSREAVFTVTSLRAPHDVLWVDDDAPAGASLHGSWTWVAADPPPFSGSRSHQSSLSSGAHQHYFQGASSRLTVNPGDVLIAYVYLDPVNPPAEVMLQWNDGSWEHRAYWGANLIGWGTSGTNSRRPMGPLPPVGEWVRLEVPASLVGLEGRTLNGMAFTLYGGRATWDHAGKGRHYDATSERTVTVDVTTVDGEAIAGEDYAPLAATLTFAPGETVKTVAVTVLGEKLEEPDESFRVRLERPVDAALSKAEGVGTILDDDVFTLHVDDLYLVESKPTAEVVLRLDRASEDTISVQLATADDVALAGEDYGAVVETVVFAPGEVERRVPVTFFDDAAHEGPERFWVELSDPVGTHLARPRAGVHLLDDEKPASYPLTTAIRDFKPSHPDIHNCGSRPRPATVLAEDGKPAYSSGGTGAANFDQWFHDAPGVNLGAGYDIGFTFNGSQYEYLATSAFWPVDGKLYGNEGSHNYQFTTELHAWFTYEPGATILFGSDDDGWCFVNRRLSHDLYTCHGPFSRTVSLDTLAPTHGLVPGESYRLDCFQAERGRGGSAFYFQTPLYLQQFEPGTLQVDPLAVTAAEGTQVAFQVERVGGAFGAASATFAATGGTATSGEDYPPVATPVAFGHGDRAPRQVPVTLVDDGIVEGDETIELELVAASPAQSLTAFGRAEVTVVDDESYPALRLRTPVVAEGSRGEQIVLVGIELVGENRHGATIDFATVDGTAVAGSDYRTTSGTLQLPAGTTFDYLQILILGDTVPEDDEWLKLAFSGSGFLGGQATLRLDVADDDRCITPNLAANADFALPGSGGQIPGWTTVSGNWVSFSTGGDLNVYMQNSASGELRQDIDLSGFESFVDRGAQRFAFHVDLSTWAAENPMDTGRVILELWNGERTQVLASFDSGEVRKGDGWKALGTVLTAPPGSRWLRVRLLGKRYRSSNVNAHFDRLVAVGLDVPSLIAGDATFPEGQAGPAALAVPVALTCPSDRPVTVDYATFDGSAVAGEDYHASLGTLSLAPGTLAAAVPLTVLGDTLQEGNETLVLRLQNPDGAVIPDGEIAVTLVDDESSLAIQKASAREGNEGTTPLQFTVTLQPALSLPVTVDYATVDYTATAGEDYVAASGTLTFEPGETSQVITVQATGDTEVEEDEDFFVELSNPNNAWMAMDRGRGTIRQDDIFLTVGDAQILEGSQGTVPMLFEVALSSPSSEVVTVHYTTVDGLAVAGLDYQERSGTLSFPAGNTLASVTVPVIGDLEAEGGETFLLQLGSPSGAYLLDPEESGTGFIVDDDDCGSPNLLSNPGAEVPIFHPGVPEWTQVVGATWGARTSSPSPFAGGSYFAPGTVAEAELRQDVDVSLFAAIVDRGVQRFLFEGFVQSGNTSPADLTRIVVEYRDAANATVLASFDSGELASVGSWRNVGDLQVAPAGTRWIRVRLIARRTRSSGYTYAFFDALNLRSLGTPIFEVDDIEIAEADTESVFGAFEVRLACPAEETVTIDYATADETATAGSDYLPAAGTLTYAPGETSRTVEVEVLGDYANERLETFRLHLSSPVDAVLMDDQAVGSIRDGDLAAPPVAGTARIYTLDEDFDLGFAVAVDHDPPGSDQLQLAEQSSTFPFLWVAASGKGTIVKIDTRNGEVLGEYSTNPDNRGNSNPSRTTVGLDGSVWVGNRNDSSATHIGLAELGQCVDRNGNGVIETSTGYTNILPWPNAQGQDAQGGVSTAADECILHYVKLPYSCITRHVSVDREGDVWLGCYGTGTGNFALVDGTSGEILRTSGNLGCGGYGGFVDQDGILWSSHLGWGVLRWDPAVDPPTAESKRCIHLGGAYGLALGASGDVYINDHTRDRIFQLDSQGALIRTFPRGSRCGQGLAVDTQGDVWSSSARFCSGTNLSHVKGDGTYVGTMINVPTGTTGVSVDAAGKVWAAADQASKVLRVDPHAGPIGADGVTPIGNIDLVIDIPGANPYNYSDMTGSQLLRFTAPQGSWTVIQDAGAAGAEWGTVVWNTEPQAFVPEGGTVLVEVRAADTLAGLGGTSWLAVESGARFQVFGRYLQVRGTLKSASGGVTPVLSDLRIGSPGRASIGDVEVEEGDSGVREAVFAVTLEQPVAHDVEVGYATADGTATAGADYNAAAGSVVVPAGAVSASVVVGVIGDTELEPDEVLAVHLTPLFGADIVDGTGEGRILDDDTALVAVEKVDALEEDRDGNGVVTPGDVVRYTITITSLSDGPTAGLVLEDPVPDHTTVVAGSVTAVGGVVESESPVRVALDELPAGGTATVSFAVALAAPWPDGVEQVVNQGQLLGLPTGPVASDDPDLPGTEDPTLTPVAAVPVLAAAKRDALLEDRNGDGLPSPGDLVAYEVELANTGTVAATGVLFQDVAPAYTGIVPGSVVASAGTVESEDPVRVALPEVAANQTVAIVFAVEVDWPVPPGVDQIVNQGTVTSAELPAVLTDDPDLPGRQDPTVTPLAAAPRLVASKVDALAVDEDGDGVPSPGDVVAYTLTVLNHGNTAATAVAVLDEVPEHTELVAGSVAASAGTVTAQDPVQVVVEELAAGDELTVAFQVRIVTPIEPWVADVVNQATVWSTELPELLSDDPDKPGAADPTVTPVVASPVLTVSKTDVLYEDGNGDGFASPGEELLYQFTVGNGGNTAATEVTLSDPLPALATLVPGTVQTSHGTVVSESPIEVALGTLPMGAEATVSFRVLLGDPSPEPISELSNQATVTATELTPVPSDDPETPEPGDPTVTELVVPIELSVADVTVTEAESAVGGAVFEVVLSRAPRADVSVAYATADATAAAGADYAAATGTLVIPAGETAGAIVVPVVDDTMDEPDETLTLTLSAPVGVVIVDGEATGTILDDDEPPVLTVADVAVGEGDDGTTPAVFTLELSAPSGWPVQVAWSSGEGTAAAGADFMATGGVVGFAPGEVARQVTVEVVGDRLDEHDETFLLQLATPVAVLLASEQARGTILDDDLPPELSVGDVTVVEGDAGTVPAAFAVTLSTPSGREIQVAYATADLEASSGADYVPLAGTLVVPAGSTAAAVTVGVLGDGMDEPDERLELRLSDPVHVELTDGVGVGTILDDDEPPTLSVGDATVHEGDSGLVEVSVPLTLSTPSGFVVTVDFATADVTATSPADYLPRSDTAVIAAGTAGGLATLEVRGDRVDELDETFAVLLTAAARATLADAEAVVTIVDDDEALAAVDDVTVAEGDEGTADAVFTLRLSTESDREVRFDYETIEGTATETADYLAAAGTVTLPPGSVETTVPVAVVGDRLLEDAEEAFTLELSNPVETAFADPVGVGTILDDERCVGPTLLVNGGGESRPVSGEVPAWSEVAGTDWSRVYLATEPAAFAGQSSLTAGVFDAEAGGLGAELAQTVDLAPFADLVDGGGQRFLATATVRTAADSGDTARIVVEYLDSAGTLLDAYDSGPLTTAGAWLEIVDERAVPAGARAARVRLLAGWGEGETLETWFDAVALRPLRVAVVTVADLVAYEGDDGQHDGIFRLRLSCPYGREVEAGYATADGSATAGLDYLATSGTALFPVGSTEQPAPVPILGDLLYEGNEGFFLDLVLPPGEPAVLLDPRGDGLILDDDFCPRSPGYWKNHPWPVDHLVIAGREVEAVELAAMLSNESSDASAILARQLVAASFNLLVGGDPHILPVVEAADAFLAEHPPGSDPKGELKQEANAIKDALDDYNNTRTCQETHPIF